MQQCLRMRQNTLSSNESWTVPRSIRRFSFICRALCRLTHCLFLLHILLPLSQVFRIFWYLFCPPFLLRFRAVSESMIFATLPRVCKIESFCKVRGLILERRDLQQVLVEWEVGRSVLTEGCIKSCCLWEDAGETPPTW